MESYAILGWGVSARAAYRYLSHRPHGDMRIYLPEGELCAARAEDEALPLVPDTMPIREELIVRSPGIRPDTPALRRACAAGATLTSEIALFIAACPAPIYGVTGSDGKTTTATLAARMCEAMGYTTYLGGNIGVSLLDALPVLRPADRVVLELSSFQLMGYTPALAGAAITNLSENHLNWHTDMTEYREAKRNILRRAARRVVNARLTEPLSTLTHSAYVEEANYHLSHGMLMHGEEPLVSASCVKLRGIHNVENILCAAALTNASAQAVASVARAFEGVAHRMQFCGHYRGVACWNSSIDTTPTRTAATLAALPRGMTVLCGGAGKNLSYLPLAEALCRYAGHVVFTGEAGREMQAALADTLLQGDTLRRHLPTYTYLPDFCEAVGAALKETQPGGTLVLSPAATSFDRFSSYRERGETFLRCLEMLQRT